MGKSYRGTAFRAVKEIKNLCVHYKLHLLINSVEMTPSCEAASRSITQKFPKFYGTQKFITVFTKSLH
jgi:hypothetical protein